LYKINKKNKRRKKMKQKTVYVVIALSSKDIKGIFTSQAKAYKYGYGLNIKYDIFPVILNEER